MLYVKSNESDFNYKSKPEFYIYYFLNKKKLISINLISSEQINNDTI